MSEEKKDLIEKGANVNGGSNSVADKKVGSCEHFVNVNPWSKYGETCGDCLYNKNRDAFGAICDYPNSYPEPGPHNMIRMN